MHNLTEFNKKLQRDYPRYRIRFSPFRDSYIIEVKMGTGYWNVDTSYDEDMKIQVRDGYVEWGEITRGDRKKCYHCTNTVSVPVREFREHKCNWCGMSQPVRAYFELNDDLLYHFNKLRSKRTDTGSMRSFNSSIADRNLDKSVDDAAYLAKENQHLLYGNPRSIGRKVDWHNVDVVT